MTLTIYETVTSTIIAALRRGVVPWRKPWSGGNATPVNAISQRPYRGVNVFLLSLTEYSDHRWLTQRQAEEKGASVKPDERSTMVVFWKRWQPPVGEDEPDSSVKRPAPVLRYFRVFNAEQCEGLNLPAPYDPPEADHQRIARADQLVQSMPNPPIIREGSAAWYRPADDLVQVPPLRSFKSADSYYATLFHELGHASGSASRLNRAGVTDQIQFGSGTYSKEELVAELTSAFLCASVSLDNSVIEDSASYIQGWLSVLRADPKAVVIAAAQAQKAADHIKGVQYGL